MTGKSSCCICLEPMKSVRMLGGGECLAEGERGKLDKLIREGCDCHCHVIESLHAELKSQYEDINVLDSTITQLQAENKAWLEGFAKHDSQVKLVEKLQADKAELVKAGDKLATKWLMCLDLGRGTSMDSGEFDIHVNKFKILLAKHSTSTQEVEHGPDCVFPICCCPIGNEPNHSKYYGKDGRNGSIGSTSGGEDVSTPNNT